MIAEAVAPRFNPFPGLRSFEPDEDHLFFGRERQVDELLGRLRRTRFLSVVGTSGSGKSSLVRSGLIPSLHGGAMVKAGSSWRIAILRPGDDPIGNLAAALAHPEVLGGEDAGFAELGRSLLEATLRRSALGLVECVRQARLPAGDNVLVLVDQFEELFRFKRNPRIADSHDEAVAFVRLLLETAAAGAVPVYVVLTMRSDFIGDCTELPGLAEAVNDGQYLVPRMTREERRSAVVGPIAVGGGEISPRLVTRLLNDVGDDPDQLPILQHALMRTWDFWEGHHAPGEPLDLRHYEATGTMKEALSQHAEEAFRELDGEGERRLAEVLFKSLTDRGSDSRGIRRPLRLAEAAALAGATEAEMAAVVERFRAPGRSFLMPPAGVPLGPDTVLDISHESLMRIWRRLIDWVDDEARAAQIYLRLSKSAAQYQEGTGGLWRDPELQLAVNWREEARPTAAWAERYDPAWDRAMLFLEHSKHERDLYLERRERERRRQLRRARWLAIVLGTGAIVTLAFGLWALTLKLDAEVAARESLSAQRYAEGKQREARRQRENAEAQRLLAEQERTNAEQSRRLAEGERERAELESRRAEEEKQRAVDEKQKAVVAGVEAQAARQDAEAQREVAVAEQRRAERFSAEARQSEAEARRLAVLQTARALAVQGARLAQAGKGELPALLALEAYRLNERHGGEADDPAVYDALAQALARLDPAATAVLDGHRDAVRALAMAGGGRLVATGSDDGGVRLFDLSRPGTGPAVLAAPGGAGVRALALSPDGARLAAGRFDGSIALFELGAGGNAGAPRALAGHGAAVTALAFVGPDRLASAGADGAVRLRGLGDPERAVELAAGGPHRPTALAADPRGRRLALGSAGGGVLVWELGGGDRGGGPGAPRALARGADVRAVALDAKGGRLAAGTGAGRILLWQLGDRGEGTGDRPAELAGHAAPVTALAFAAGRDLLASASLDRSVRLWDPERPAREPIALADHGGWVWAVAVSPDGERVVSGGADRAARVRPTRVATLATAACARLSRDLTPAEAAEYLAGVTPVPTCER